MTLAPDVKQFVVAAGASRTREFAKSFGCEVVVVGSDVDADVTIPGGWGAAGAPNDGWHQFLHVVRRARERLCVGRRCIVCALVQRSFFEVSSVCLIWTCSHASNRATFIVSGFVHSVASRNTLPRLVT